MTSIGSVWHAVVFMCGLCLTAQPTELTAAPVPSSIEPFGLSTSPVAASTLLEKWLNVEREVEIERKIIENCQKDRASCQSGTALQFLAIISRARMLEGRARLGEINRSINLKIKPRSDLSQYGAEDVWSPPLATFAREAGDCEDYAIAKFVALQEAGISPDDLHIVILRVWKEHHAVVAARLDGKWLLLDNLHMIMVEDQSVLNYYRPVFLIDHDRVSRYSGQPSISERPNRVYPAGTMISVSPRHSPVARIGKPPLEGHSMSPTAAPRGPR